MYVPGQPCAVATLRYDAGDNVKFNLPMAWSAGVLAWSIVDFEAGYKAAGEYKTALDSVKWVTDYFIKCVGDGKTDIVVQVRLTGLAHDGELTASGAAVLECSMQSHAATHVSLAQLQCGCCTAAENELRQAHAAASGVYCCSLQ
jgi:hypothetical protein